MGLWNLTPHPITLVGRFGQHVTLGPSVTPARCAVEREEVGEFTVDHGLTVPVNTTRFGQVTGLPEPEEGVWYVVALPVAQARPDRRDLYVVDDTVRDEAGRVVGARALAQVPVPEPTGPARAPAQCPDYGQWAGAHSSRCIVKT